jgi:hypothetical protein
MQTHRELPISAMNASKLRIAFKAILSSNEVGFGLALPAQAALLFSVTNLVTDDQSAHPAVLTDPKPQRMGGASRARGPRSVLGSDNGTGKATLYAVEPDHRAHDPERAGRLHPWRGQCPPARYSRTSPAVSTATLSSSVSEDGTISGWRSALNTTAEVLQTGLTSNVYKGSAFATIGAASYLYAANFHTGKIDVLKGDAGFPNLAGNFTDPALPSGYAPFNIQNINGRLYVTYAKTDGAGGADEVPRSRLRLREACSTFKAISLLA